MGLFNRFKKESPEPAEAKPAVSLPLAEKKVVEPKKSVIKSADSSPKQKTTQPIKGKTQLADRILIKPLVTEKAAEFSAVGKYIFVVNPKMNKVEVKKAVRQIYGVDPIRVNMTNVRGRQVRYGRVAGKTKSWKKAIVTLKAGDKIEIYEGV